MLHPLEIIILLLFTYSFAGWFIETVWASVHHKSFQNRGFASGPFCYVYGITALVLAIFLQDLRDRPAVLFLGCAIISTVIEWLTAKLLERLRSQKWWDYSGYRFNIDGYVCLRYSLIWGALGAVTVLFVNDLLVRLYAMIPVPPRAVISWILFCIGIVDLGGTWLIMRRFTGAFSRLLSWNHALSAWTLRLGRRIEGRIQQRVERAYPAPKPAETRALMDAFGLTELFWMFFLGALIGDVAETLFCRLSIGYWMSRSSVVWGPFSVVWGLAMSMSTVLLRKSAAKPDSYIFVVGTFAGGAFEYLCSVFTELVFGKRFWDYSHLPFNLDGRINLLFCFFWGIAAVVWIRLCCPPMLRMIRWVRLHTRRILTFCLALFMSLDMAVSFAALLRYDARQHGLAPANRIDRILDERYPNEAMERIYPMARVAERPLPLLQEAQP